MPGWLRTWFIIAAIAGGAVLVWFSITFLVILFAVTLLPYWLWRLLTRSRNRRTPVTIEGEIVSHDTLPLRTTPLTEEQQAKLAATPVWVVWHEGESHAGAERASFGVAVCLSEQDAWAFIARPGGKTLVRDYGGYQVLGPENPLTTPLFGEQRAAIIGAILDRLESGSRAPIPMRDG